MRRHAPTLSVLVCCVAGAAATARADLDLGPVRASGYLEGGGRVITGDDHSGKFEEYRDPHEGLFGAGDLMLEDPGQLHFLRFGGFDVGEEDGEYFFEGGRWGRWGLFGNYSQIPHNFSDRALTPYQGIAGGDLTLPFAPPTDTATFESSVTGAARDAKLGFDTDQANLGLWFDPTSGSRLRAGYRSIHRDGRRPETMFFGFSNFVHIPQPVDDQIHEGKAELSYAGDSFNVGLDYTASVYENDFRSIRVDNPAAFAGGSVRGAVAADPDNSAQLVSLTSGAALPTGFPLQIAGTLAYGQNRQDEGFAPLTVNPALAPAPLPAHDLDGDVRPFLANLLITSRPLPKLEVRGRYRLRDYDNRSNEILFTQTSVADAGLALETKRSYAPSYTTQNASLETSYRLASATKATLGFAWDRWHRGPEREVRNMDEYSPEIRLDTRAGKWARLRTSYSYRVREGDPYNELAPFNALEPGVPRGPLTPPIRKYDEADNQRHNLHAQSQFFAGENADVTLSGNLHVTDWDDHFGLVSEDGFDIGIDAGYRPHERVELSLYYTYDWSQLHQRSASSSGTLEWRSDAEDTGHTAGIDVAFAILPQRVTLTTGFFVHSADGKTRTSGAPADAVDFPDIEDMLWAPTANLQYRYDDHVSFIAGYRFEHYDQKNWQYDGLGVTRGTSNVEGAPLLGTNNDVFLHNGLEDFAAHLFSLSVKFEL
jgi:MtrB/PioB family decaheme-associated outer membrane protein